MALAIVFIISASMGVVSSGAEARPSTVKLVDAPFPDADMIDDLFIEDFAILGATGIYIGDARGRANPMQPLTRAEFCVVSLRVLNLERLARAMEMQDPDFPDVVDAWMFGWINAASARGIVVGYPDGSFRPQNDVSFAEASTMLLRALRYDILDPWPAGPYSQAIELGIIDDDVFATGPNMLVTREDMARMVRNAMFEVPRAVDGVHPEAEGVGEDDWRYLFTFEQGHVEVVDLEKGTITIDRSTYDFAPQVTLYNARDLVALEDTEILFLLNKKGEVAYINADVVSRITGEFIELDLDEEDSTVTIKLDGQKETYDLRYRVDSNGDFEKYDVTVRINDRTFNLNVKDDVDTVLAYEDDGYDVTLTVADGVVNRMVFVIDTYEDVLFMDIDYNEDDDEATVEIHGEDGLISKQLQLDKDTAIHLNGKRTDLEALHEAWDDFASDWDAPAVVTARTRGDSHAKNAYVIWMSVITDDIIEGELKRIGRDWVRIDNKDYDYDDNYLSRDDFRDVGIDNDIAVLRNHAGHIQVILAAEPVDDQYFAVLADYVQVAKNQFDVDLELADGTEVTLRDIKFPDFSEDRHMGRVVFVIDDADIYDVNDPALAVMGFDYEVKTALRYRTSTSTVLRYYTNDAAFSAALSPLAGDVFYYDLVGKDFESRGKLSAGDLLHEVFLLDGVVGYVRFVPAAYVNLKGDDLDKTRDGDTAFTFVVTSTFGNGLKEAHTALDSDVLIDIDFSAGALKDDALTVTARAGGTLLWTHTFTGVTDPYRGWLSEGDARDSLKALAGKVHEFTVEATTTDADLQATLTLWAVAGETFGDADDPDEGLIYFDRLVLGITVNGD